MSFCVCCCDGGGSGGGVGGGGDVLRNVSATFHCLIRETLGDNSDWRRHSTAGSPTKYCFMLHSPTQKKATLVRLTLGLFL